jgi:hypothetical protein
MMEIDYRFIELIRTSMEIYCVHERKMGGEKPSILSKISTVSTQVAPQLHQLLNEGNLISEKNINPSKNCEYRMDSG